MPIFCVKSVKIYTGQKNLHEYTRGSRDKYQVWLSCDPWDVIYRPIQIPFLCFIDCIQIYLFFFWRRAIISLANNSCASVLLAVHRFKTSYITALHWTYFVLHICVSLFVIVHTSCYQGIGSQSQRPLLANLFLFVWISDIFNSTFWPH